jgi:hypothetical protein
MHDFIVPARKAYRAVGGWQGAFGWFFILLGVPVFLELLRSHQDLNQVEGVGALLFLFLGIVLIAFFAGFSVVISTNPERDHVGWAALILLFGLSGTAYVLSGATLSVAVLAKHGFQVSFSPPQQTLDVGDLQAKMLFEALSTVPLLDIPATLGWEDPVPDPAAPLGWAALLVKLLLILVAGSGTYRLIRAATRMRRHRLASNASENPAAPDAGEDDTAGRPPNGITDDDAVP